MKKVITFGVFDYFHLGHLRLFKQAKSLGDYLIVAVQNGDYILKSKPNSKIMYSTEERVELVSSIKYVDEVYISTDVDDNIKTVDFDILALGEDQNHEGFQRAIKWCEEHGKQVVRLKRTQNICSTDIKKNVNKMGGWRIDNLTHSSNPFVSSHYVPWCSMRLALC